MEMALSRKRVKAMVAEAAVGVDLKNTKNTSALIAIYTPLFRVNSMILTLNYGRIIIIRDGIWSLTR
jgi:hypothetical protein